MRLPLALAVLLAAPACLPDPHDTVQFVDDFEACDDLCDWSVGADVTRVSTYHPAEHGMRLGPGAAATHALAIDRPAADGDWQPVTNADDGNWLELSTDCQGPGSLELRAVGPDQYAIDVVLDDRGVGGFTRHRVTFPPLDPTRAAHFVLLDLRARSRACVVDNLQIRIPGGTFGY